MNNNQDYAGIINKSKEINDRQQIINEFIKKRFLYKNEREEAIKKIKELRASDEKVLSVAILEQANGSIPLVQASDEALVVELDNQIKLLKTELIEENGDNKF